MVDDREKVREAGLEKTVARVAMVVRDQHPREDKHRLAVGVVERAWWGNIGAGEESLPGGRARDVDFGEQEASEGDVEHVMAQTALRRLREELGVQIALEDLRYVGLFNNGEWVTALFYCLLEQRPTITIVQQASPLDQIDGFRWAEVHTAVTDEDTFADHGLMIQSVIDALTMDQQSPTDQ